MRRHSAVVNPVLQAHFKAYPHMQPQDAVKLLFQCCFGAGHAVSGSADCLLGLQQEYANTPQSAGPLWEEIGGGNCRVQLCALDAHGILPTALNTLFVEGAQTATAPQGDFARALDALRQLAAQGLAPFSGASCEAYLAAYIELGYPAVSHSETYREAYSPAYRVLPLSLAKLLPLCSAVERRLSAGQSCILAIDGRCGAGKTSLANLLQKLYKCAMIRMDDFYLPQELRTAQRLQTPGGNIHFERFSTEVSRPLAAGQVVSFRAYDCAEGEFGPGQSVAPGGLVVIEGSYSLHPQCETPCDIRAFLTVAGLEQRSRLQQRESPEAYARFLSDWIPMEEAYFSAFHIAEGCDFIIDTSC